MLLGTCKLDARIGRSKAYTDSPPDIAGRASRNIGLQPRNLACKSNNGPEGINKVWTERTFYSTIFTQIIRIRNFAISQHTYIRVRV